ncbi:hypothetical protein LTR94_029366, partial [Friedmanniomyces endolithicus]
SSSLEAAWGTLAAASELVSALADKADAEAEAARQVNLFGAPMVVEVLQVSGLRVDLTCKAVTLTASRAGYTAGTTVFVLGAKELDQVERTNLTVLRKLS